MPQVKLDLKARFIVCGYLGEPRCGEYFCKFCSRISPPPPRLCCPLLAIMHSPSYHALAWLSCTRLFVMHSPGYHVCVWLSFHSPGYHAFAWLACTRLAIMYSSGCHALAWLYVHMYSLGYHVLAWLSCTRLDIMHSASYSFLPCAIITLSIVISLGRIDLSGLPCLS
jgi:hypothetical protein